MNTEIQTHKGDCHVITEAEDYNDAFGTPRNAGNHQKLEEMKDPLLEP